MNPMAASDLVIRWLAASDLVIRWQRDNYCWAKLRGSRTLRCIKPKGHKGRHSRLHMVYATVKVTKEMLDKLRP